MPESSYLALLLIGLLGGTHCVGMCGGIVGALSVGGPTSLTLHLAYNAGRLFSYSLAGAIAGALGEASIALSGQLPLRLILSFLANLMLIALGLYLMGAGWALSVPERLGQRLWRRLQPMTRNFLPARSAAQAFPLGLLWGWLPCGLVYTALANALTSGSALHGSGLMLAFGVGTLPNLLLAGVLASRLQRYTQLPAIRLLSGLLILCFGLWGLFASTRMLLAI